MAINSDLKSHTPEELPADNEVAEAPRNEEPQSGEKSKAVVGVSGEVDGNAAVLDPEEGGATTLPDVEEYEQILEELRHAKTSKQLRIAGTISSLSTSSRSGSQASSPLPSLSGASWDATVFPPLPRAP